MSFRKCGECENTVNDDCDDGKVTNFGVFYCESCLENLSEEELEEIDCE